MDKCAFDDCNGPTLPNSEYCLMHRKLNKKVVNSEEQTSYNAKGVVQKLLNIFVILCFLQLLNPLGMNSIWFKLRIFDPSVCFITFLILIAILTFTSRSSN